MKRVIISALLCAVLVLSALVTTAAEQIPTLYWNDEVWYRDAISPLVEKNGIYYVPAEMCAMFEGIKVKTAREENVLVYNTETGGYISVLLNKNKAVINGEIIETESFRDGGACYIDARLICEATGLISEFFPDGSGGKVMRLSDSDVTMEFSEVIEASKNEDNEGGFPNSDTNAGEIKVLYLLCEADSGELYSVCDTLEAYQLDFTCFVSEYDSEDEIFLAASHGEFGLVYGGDPDRLDSLTDKCRSLTGRTARAVLYGDRAAEERGYAALEPVITVGGGGYAMSDIRNVIEYLGDHDSCVIFIETSWNGTEFIRLVSELDRYTFEISNINN